MGETHAEEHKVKLSSCGALSHTGERDRQLLRHMARKLDPATGLLYSCRLFSTH
jgi:hypothetical protein